MEKSKKYQHKSLVALIRFLHQNNVPFKVFIKHAQDYDKCRQFHKWIVKPKGIYVCILRAFYWKETPEGYDFWLKMYKKAAKKEM